MIRLRSTRSASAPAIGPSRTAGATRAAITPATAYAPADPPSRSARMAAALNPIQSPRDEIVCAASNLLNDGWVSRSLKVAGLVPLSCATSSAMLDN